MCKKIISLLCAIALLLSVSALADRPAPETVEGKTYISDHLESASALYVAGRQAVLDDTYFYGAGYATDQEITDQIPNQYGICAVVLAAGAGTEVTLNNPTIESDPESYANGVFSAAMAKVTVNGGTISTNNSSGHGIDATYMGYVSVKDTKIHTAGETSGALATDFGGGFIHGENLTCETESGSSPGIFCAGSTVIYLKDSHLSTGTATGIVVAHDHAVVVLDHCQVDAAGTAVNGLQALPNPASSDGSTFYAFGGKLASSSSAVVGESGGRTVVNLIGTECTAGGDTAISCKGDGILTVNLWDTELTGKIACDEGCTVTVNICTGGRLTGEVTGEGTVAIHVFDGGEYTGPFAAAQSGEGEAAPVLGTFDDYLVKHWASGSSAWTESRAQNYAANIEPKVLQNSAACLAEDGAAAKPYHPESWNPSETGVDLSLLNVGGAHGFTVDEIFGSGGKPEGIPEGFEPSSGDGFGESSGASASQERSDATSGATAKSPESGAASGSAVSTILGVGTTQAFTDDPVPKEDLETILSAGLSAASAINQQPWYFVAVTNRDIMAELSGSPVPSGSMPEGAPAGGSEGAPSGGDFGSSEGAPAGGFEPSEGGSAGGSASPVSSGPKAGLGDSPAAIIIYRNDKSSSPNPDFDCGLAAQNMVIAAASLGYGVKIVSSPTTTLNGANHDAICEKLGVDPALQAVAVLLIGRPDVDAVSGASTRKDLEDMSAIIE